jgi:dTDP-4-dehydrorhamnose reductase
MKVLIIGGTGLLGFELSRVWSAGDEVQCVGYPDIDIRNAATMAQLVGGMRADWVVLAAAYADVDGCETEVGAAYDINGAGAATVARLVREYGGRLMYLSTDYVFDGAGETPRESGDPINPQSIYGLTKAAGELAVRTFVPDACIVRTAWLFGRGGKCFPEAILKRAQQQVEIAVVNDQRGCPTYNRHLAEALARLVRAGARGIVHATNAGHCTWFEFAQEILRQAGLSHVVVRPITTAELNRPARRPHYSVLSSRSLEAYGFRMPSWQAAVEEYVRRNKELY